MRITKFLIFLLTFVLACEKSDDVSSNQEQTNLTTNNQTEELSENSYNSESTETNTDQTFSREEMLRFIVNQIIIPAYDNLDSSLGDLKTSFDLFNTNVSEENLTDLRNKWLNSYKLWQHVEKKLGFDKSRTLFVDDSLPVLDAAKKFGIKHLLAVANPDSTQATRQIEHYNSIEDYRTLLPIKK